MIIAKILSRKVRKGKKKGRQRKKKDKKEKKMKKKMKKANVFKVFFFNNVYSTTNIKIAFYLFLKMLN